MGRMWGPLPASMANGRLRLMRYVFSCRCRTCVRNPHWAARSFGPARTSLATCLALVPQPPRCRRLSMRSCRQGGQLRMTTARCTVAWPTPVCSSAKCSSSCITCARTARGETIVALASLMVRAPQGRFAGSAHECGSSSPLVLLHQARWAAVLHIVSPPGRVCRESTKTIDVASSECAFMSTVSAPAAYSGAEAHT